VRIDKEGEDESLLVQVMDSGGGTAKADMDRIFTPQIRADEPLVEGAADRGASLFHLSRIIESSHGKIWVESDHEHFTTFFVKLPVITGEGDGR